MYGIDRLASSLAAVVGSHACECSKVRAVAIASRRVANAHLSNGLTRAWDGWLVEQSSTRCGVV